MRHFVSYILAHNILSAIFWPTVFCRLYFDRYILSAILCPAMFSRATPPERKFYKVQRTLSIFNCHSDRENKTLIRLLPAKLSDVIKGNG